MVSLKEQKEAFVAGNEGTSPLEIFVICASTAIGLAFYRQVTLRLQPVVTSSATSSSSTIRQVLLECLVFILPLILCQSNWLYPWGVSILLLEMTLAYGLKVALPFRQSSLLSLASLTSSVTATSLSPNQQGRRLRRLGFITAYRSSLLFLTFCAILAVDFPLFPRRLAKTEVFGYGLMDLGAASTIIAGGIMTSSSSTSSTITASSTTTTTTKRRWKIRQWLIFLGLGFLRLVTHKNVDYQEHVSEYGVHWNFYFTLSFISILSSMLARTSSSNAATSSWGWFFRILPLLSLLCLYQIVLQFGLQTYVEDAPRHCPMNDDRRLSASRSLLVIGCDLVAANREGIFSCVGYSFMWWTSQQIAKEFIWVPLSSPPPTTTIGKEEAEKDDAKSGVTRHTTPRRLRLGEVAAMLWLLHAILVYGLNIPVSRRTTNASFCVWTLAHNFSLLFLYWTILGDDDDSVDERDGKSLLPPLCLAVNRHGMPAFVVANLLTGIINLSIPTLEMSDTAALAILLTYLLVVGCLGLVLDELPKLLRRNSRQTSLKVD